MFYKTMNEVEDFIANAVNETNEKEVMSIRGFLICFLIKFILNYNSV